MKTKLFLLGLALLAASVVKAQTVTKQEKGYFNLSEIGYTGGNHNTLYVTFRPFAIFS